MKNRWPRWFQIAFGVVIAFVYLTIVVVAIVNPTIETLTGLATVTIPVVLLGLDQVVRWIRSRRR